MDKLLPFLIQSSIALTVFYMYFYFFLRKSKLFQLNRIYLLSSSVLAVLIPLLHFPSFSSGENTKMIKVMLQEVSVVASYNVQPQTQEANFLNFVYIFGLVVFFFLFSIKIIGLYRLVQKSKFVNKGFYRLVEVAQRNIAFSFFKYVFISEDIKEETKIISHELVHVNQKHSIDVLIINIVQGILWFNPLIYFFKKAIQENHEYIADQEVIKHHSAGGYLQLLLSQTMAQTVGVTNCFAQSNLKKRMIMMKKKKNVKYAFVNYISAFVLPVAMIFTMDACSSSKDISKDVSKSKIDEIIEVKTQNLSVSTEATVGENYVHAKVEQMPEFVGGLMELYKYIAYSVKYPIEAMENGIQGRVFVAFVIEKDGSISSVKVLRPVNPLLDAEAVRVVASMPKWIPGTQDSKPVRVSFTVPISFSLRERK